MTTSFASCAAELAKFHVMLLIQKPCGKFCVPYFVSLRKFGLAALGENQNVPIFCISGFGNL